jgi:hypothetical protein
LDSGLTGGGITLYDQRLTYKGIAEWRNRSIDLRLSSDRKGKSPVFLLFEESLFIQPHAGVLRIRKQLVLSIIVRFEIFKRVISAMFEVTAEKEMMFESLGIG